MDSNFNPPSASMNPAVTAQPLASDSLAAKIETLRDYLRFHGDTRVTIDPWGPYGTVSIEVKQPGQPPWYDKGNSFEKRIDHALERLGVEQSKENR